MTTVLWAALVLALLIIIVLLLLLVRYQAAAMQTHTAKRIEHNDCVDHMVWHLRGQFAGIVLRDAADKWESAANQHVLTGMRNAWRPGDRGVASQWMLDQADKWLEVHP